MTIWLCPTDGNPYCKMLSRYLRRYLQENPLIPAEQLNPTKDESKLDR